MVLLSDSYVIIIVWFTRIFCVGLMIGVYFFRLLLISDCYVLLMMGFPWVLGFAFHRLVEFVVGCLCPFRGFRAWTSLW